MLAIAALIVLAELLGTFAAFEDWTMIAAAARARRGGALGGRALRRPRRPSPRRRRRRGVAARDLARGRAPCAVVAAAWMVPTLGSLAGGMDRADTLWYHMPLATRFAERRPLRLDRLLRPDLLRLVSTRRTPRSSTRSPILAFGRDILSPLLNLGWLALGLPAAYASAAPTASAPRALIGGAIALGAQNLVEFQAGEALNDIVGVALILCAVAVLVNAVGGAGSATATAP